MTRKSMLGWRTEKLLNSAGAAPPSPRSRPAMVNAPAAPPGSRLEMGHPFLGHVDHAFGDLQEGPASGGGFHIAGVSVEQAGAQPLLQRGDLASFGHSLPGRRHPDLWAGHWSRAWRGLGMRTLRIGGRCRRLFRGSDRTGRRVGAARRSSRFLLVFECLAERTIALAQQARLGDPEAEFDPMLDCRMQAVLPVSTARRVRIVNNMGAANRAAPPGSVCAIARELGIRGLRVAAVLGDDVLTQIREGAFVLEETGRPATDLETLISANAYVGAAPIVEALGRGADVLICGRVSIRPCSTRRWCIISAGLSTIGEAWARARWSATCWSAPRRSVVAISPTLA